MSPQLEGLSQVLIRFNRVIDDIELKTKAGLTEACLVLKADSVRITPVDLSNLRGSAFIKVTSKEVDNPSPSFDYSKGGDFGSDHYKAISEIKQITENSHLFIGVVAYSANYAFWVHEMPATNNFNSGENAFLLKSIMKNKGRVLGILTKWSRI